MAIRSKFASKPEIFRNIYALESLSRRLRAPSQDFPRNRDGSSAIRGLHHTRRNIHPQFPLFRPQCRLFAATATVIGLIWVCNSQFGKLRALPAEIVPNPGVLSVSGISCSSFVILCAQSAVVVPESGFLSPIWLFL